MKYNNIKKNVKLPAKLEAIDIHEFLDTSLLKDACNG